jgi:predicted nucleic acid-binding protein
MRVLVDTCIWSLALRRRPERCPDAAELEGLIRTRSAVIIGPIRQELLSGIRSQREFDLLAQHLRAYPDFAIDLEDYVTAASFYNQCRAAGLQGSMTDFLICAVAANHGLIIYTSDGDFRRFSKHLPVALHRVAGSG